VIIPEGRKRRPPHTKIRNHLKLDSRRKPQKTESKGPSKGTIKKGFRQTKEVFVLVGLSKNKYQNVHQGNEASSKETGIKILLDLLQFTTRTAKVCLFM
jgi:hypothetical protein